MGTPLLLVVGFRNLPWVAAQQRRSSVLHLHCCLHFLCFLYCRIHLILLGEIYPFLPVDPHTVPGVFVPLRVISPNQSFSVGSSDWIPTESLVLSDWNSPLFHFQLFTVSVCFYGLDLINYGVVKSGPSSSSVALFVTDQICCLSYFCPRSAWFVLPYPTNGRSF